VLLNPHRIQLGFHRLEPFDRGDEGIAILRVKENAGLAGASTGTMPKSSCPQKSSARQRR